MSNDQEYSSSNEARQFVPHDQYPTNAGRESRATGWRSYIALGPILGILMALVLAAGGTLDAVADAATAVIRSQSTGTTAQLQDEATPQATQTDTATTTAADVAALANPAVVTVRTAIEANESLQGLPNFPGQDDEEAYASGSGFLIDTEGHIVTNAHVVANGTSFEVVLLDGTVVDAQLIGYDEFADVAVLQIDLSELDQVPTPLTLGDSSTVRPGDQVVAIGSPYGDLTNTVSTGTVGAVDRTLTASSGTYGLTDLIQHDAAIYPGNSGGPLLNMNGEVIGINVAKLEITGGTSDGSFGFALAINDVKTVIEQILSGNEVQRPYLGITAQTTQDGYQVVVDVDADGPSADVLQPGDVITKINDQEISLDNPFLNLLFSYEPGDPIQLTVLRDGETTQVSVTLGTRPTETDA